MDSLHLVFQAFDDPIMVLMLQYLANVFAIFLLTFNLIRPLIKFLWTLPRLPITRTITFVRNPNRLISVASGRYFSNLVWYVSPIKVSKGTHGDFNQKKTSRVSESIIVMSGRRLVVMNDSLFWLKSWGVKMLKSCL